MSNNQYIKEKGKKENKIKKQYIAFDVHFVPYYIKSSRDDPNLQQEYCKLCDDDVSKYILSFKRDTMKQIATDANEYEYHVNSYHFDDTNMQVKLSLISKQNTPFAKFNIDTIVDDLIEHFTNNFGDGVDNLCGDFGPDCWMEADIAIHENNNSFYEYGISYLNLSNIHMVVK